MIDSLLMFLRHKLQKRNKNVQYFKQENSLLAQNTHSY